MHRIQFFSVQDLASGYYLNMLEQRLLDISAKVSTDINDLLELYNIKLYMDHEMYLKTWDETKKKWLKDQTKVSDDQIKSFFLNINSESIITLFDTVDFQYNAHFWTLIDDLSVYKNIQGESISKIIETHPHELRNILQRKRLVEKYANVIKDYCLNHPKSAELLLADENTVEKNTKFFFPTSLSDSDKEVIINQYLDSEDPNINYVSLIQYAKDSRIKLSDKTKLKAKRLQEKLTEDFLASNLSASHKMGVEIGLNRTQIEPVIRAYEDSTAKFTYSYDLFKSLIDAEDLTALFHNLFCFTDKQGLIRLINKDSEMDTMERIYMAPKSGYNAGLNFNHKDYLSLGQLALAGRLLEEESKNFSNLINRHLNKIAAFDSELNKIRFNLPNDSLATEEKIRILAPALESLLNQYQLYVSEGEIDFDLLNISSKPINFSSIGSKVSNKYVYPTQNTRLSELFHIFFSDQNLLYYVDPFKDKYTNLYSLLIHEDHLPYENFEQFQRKVLDTLISDELLSVNNEGMLKINNRIRLMVIQKLYKNGVLSYWHFPIDLRKEIDQMIKEEWCHTESTLFTKGEVSYINYYLNKKEFTDGADLRNKYLHGTNVSTDPDHNNDYLLYLRIVILCLLKIEDDLVVYRKSDLVK